MMSEIARRYPIQAPSWAYWLLVKLVARTNSLFETREMVVASRWKNDSLRMFSAYRNGMRMRNFTINEIEQIKLRLYESPGRYREAD